jgi:effector-binding domain-containing protein
MESTMTTLAPQPTVAARTTSPRDRLSQLFEEYLPKVAQRIADLGRAPAGPAYGRYHNVEGDLWDVEIGIPVDAPPANLRSLDEAERGELAVSELPGGDVATTVHIGSYDAISETYERLERFIQEQGREMGGAPWESYVVEMSEVDDPSQLRTEIFWPVT